MEKIFSFISDKISEFMFISNLKKWIEMCLWCLVYQFKPFIVLLFQCLRFRPTFLPSCITGNCRKKTVVKAWNHLFKSVSIFEEWWKRWRMRFPDNHKLCSRLVCWPVKVAAEGFRLTYVSYLMKPLSDEVSRRLVDTKHSLVLQFLKVCVAFQTSDLKNVTICTFVPF